MLFPGIFHAIILCINILFPISLITISLYKTRYSGMHFKIIYVSISLLIHNYVDKFVLTKCLYSRQQPSYFIQRDEHVVHLRKIIFIICVEQEDQFSAIWESNMGSNNAEIIYRAECRRTLFIKCFAHQGC